MRTRTKGAIAIVIVLGVIAAMSHVYLILEMAGGTVLWSADEAYFFIGINRGGHRINGLRFPVFLVENYLGGVEAADDGRQYLVVIHVRASGVKRDVLTLQDGQYGPGQFTPKHGRIYANYPALGDSASGRPTTLSQRRQRSGEDSTVSMASPRKTLTPGGLAVDS